MDAAESDQAQADVRRALLKWMRKAVEAVGKARIEEAWLAQLVRSQAAGGIGSDASGRGLRDAAYVAELERFTRIEAIATALADEVRLLESERADRSTR